MVNWNAINTLLQILAVSYGPEIFNGDKVIIGSLEPLMLSSDWQILLNAKVNMSEVRVVSIAIKQPPAGIETLNQIATTVSNPSSPVYGKYITMQDIANLVRPTPKVLSAVVSWLRSSGITPQNISWTVSQDFVQFSATLQQISDIFGVTFSVWTHQSTRTNFTGSLGPVFISSAVAPYLDYVSGVIGVPEMYQIHQGHTPVPLASSNSETVVEAISKDVSKKEDGQPKNNNMEENAEAEKLHGKKRDSGNTKKDMMGVAGSHLAGGPILPQVVRESFKIPGDLVVTLPNITNCVVEMQGNFYSDADLTAFFNKFVPFYDRPPSVSLIVGHNDPQTPSTESALDTQYLTSVAPGAQTSVMSFGKASFFTDLTEWLVYVSNVSNIPSIFSLSYGTQEYYPTNLEMDRIDIEFMKLAARGVSVIVSSGDEGSGCSTIAGFCYFYPNYPAVSPWVTAVGATMYSKGKSGVMEVVDKFASGGGFSPRPQPAPAYQAPFIADYFSTYPMLPTGYFNKHGRVLPDIVALGDPIFLIIVDGREYLVGGTSASTPVIAAFVTLLNQIRGQNHLSPMGFLNPWLYQSAQQNPSAFLDIKTGDNAIECDGCEPSGFYAGPGFDPVTGLGLPQFNVLSKMVPLR